MFWDICKHWAVAISTAYILPFGGLNVRWGFNKNGGTRSRGETNPLLVAGSFNPMNHRKEAPLAGELEPTCGQVPVVIKKNCSEVNQSPQHVDASENGRLLSSRLAALTVHGLRKGSQLGCLHTHKRANFFKRTSSFTPSEMTQVCTLAM